MTVRKHDETQTSHELTEDELQQTLTAADKDLGINLHRALDVDQGLNEIFDATDTTPAADVDTDHDIGVYRQP